MFLNGQPLACFGAKLLDVSVGAPAIQNETFQGKNAQFPRLLSSSLTAGTLTVSLVVFGTSREEVTRRLSGLLSETRECEWYLPDGFFYTCILQETSEFQFILPTQAQLDLTFLAVRHGAMVTIPLQKSGTIFCDGNREMDFILSLTASGTAAIQGITIRNISGTVVLYGMKKTVMQNGKNKFADTDLLEFPKLQPGENRISFSSGTAVVQYYPLYF